MINQNAILEDNCETKTFMIILNIANFFGPLATPIFTGAIGVFSGLYFEKYKNRTLLLTFSTSFQSLGSEIKNDFWGNIEVAHNGRSIKHLSFITINIRNTTKSDAPSPSDLDIWVDDTSSILGHSGHYDTGNAIEFEKIFGEGYRGTLDDVNEDLMLREQNNNHKTPSELEWRIRYFLANRKLALPVLNRKSNITVNFLVENSKGIIPEIHVSILQKGVKLIPEGDKVKTENIKKTTVSSIIFTLNVLGLILLYNHYKGQDEVITWSIIIGVLSYTFGYGFYYSFMYLKKIFW